MIRRKLAHVSPEELLLIPVIIGIVIAIVAQPTAITRLFEGPYATPIPGDSPADIILADPSARPASTPARTPASRQMPPDELTTTVYDRTGSRIFFATASGCPREMVLRTLLIASGPDGRPATITLCVGGAEAEGDPSYDSRQWRMVVPPPSVGR